MARKGQVRVFLDTYQEEPYGEALENFLRRKGWSRTTFLARAIETMCLEELADLGVHPDLRDR